jgi:hypothetical protein
MKNYRHLILVERTLGGGYRISPEEPLDINSLISSAINLFSKSRQEAIWKFTSIFFYHRNPSEKDILCMTIILDAIAQGLIQSEIEFVSTPPDISELDNELYTEKRRVVESAEHKGMKNWVRKHCIAKGINIAHDEVSMLGYEVDVGSFQNDIFIECGDTEPSKVFEFLKNGKKIGILQYYSEDILWFIPDNKFPSYAQEIILNLIV